MTRPLRGRNNNGAGRGREKTDRENAEEEATLRERGLGADTGNSRAIHPVNTLFQII
jgi:hypothetical protein